MASPIRRQNSVPTPGTPIRQSVSANSERPKPSFSSRRLSHDVVSVYAIRKHSAQPRLNYPGAVSSPTPSGPVSITFGYASTVHRDSLGSSQSESEPSTSSERPTDVDFHAGDFYVRLPDRQILPLFCECPSGVEADRFLEKLNDRQKEKLKRFLDSEKADAGEYYVWIRDDDSSQITVLSIKALENHLRSDKVKRVKWRHVSLDKVSVYRYSVPVITTKFRLRIVHFLSRNYRCCILCLWCFVIVCISIGIIITVCLNAQPPSGHRFTNGTTAPRAGYPHSIAHNITPSNLLTYAANGMPMGGG